MELSQNSKCNPALFLLTVGLSAWLIPGAGYIWLKETKRAVLIFLTIAATFAAGIYIGSIGVIDPIGNKPWYVAQMMASPAVAFLGYITAAGTYPAYGKPNEIGQIYTSITGLLNLLCIVNATYMAYIRIYNLDVKEF